MTSAAFSEVAVLPTFVIVGVHRSGTSALWRWLSDHPSVFMTGDKELEYFSYKYDLGPGWYTEQFAAGAAAPARGEASPSYVYDDSYMARLVGDVPGVRTVLCIRHPIERAISHYQYQRSMGWERRPIEEALADELEPPFETRFTHLRDGRYEQLFERLDRFVPRERQLIVLFDDLTDRPETVFRSLCRFIGVDSEVVPPSVGSVVNASTELRSLWVRHSMLFHRGWKVVPKRFVYWLDALNRREARTPALSPRLRRELIEYFRPSVDAAEERLGRQLPAWRT
jgi:hypothetical protein